MYPVIPELVHFWMQERQDEATQRRVARLAVHHSELGHFGSLSARIASILPVRILVASRHTTEPVSPEPCVC